MPETHINDLSGHALDYACCFAKQLNLVKDLHTGNFKIKYDLPVVNSKDLVTHFASINNSKKFKLSEVLPNIIKMNTITVSLMSGWYVELKNGDYFTAPTFYEAVAKAFAATYLKKNTLYIPDSILDSTELSDYNYFSSEI